MDDEMSNSERVYRMASVGHCLTTEDVSAINALLDECNEEIGKSVDAWHDGYKAALDAANTNAAELVRQRDKAQGGAFAQRGLIAFYQTLLKKKALKEDATPPSTPSGDGERG